MTSATYDTITDDLASRRFETSRHAGYYNPRRKGRPCLQALSSVTEEPSTQQQQTSNRQLGHSVADFEPRHSSGEQSQSAQIILKRSPTKHTAKYRHSYSDVSYYTGFFAEQT